MKKIFTLIAAVFMTAAVANAQNTPLQLGGGWNGGFVGVSQHYTFNLAKQWGAAEYAVNSDKYVKAILNFDEPLDNSFQVNYLWKSSADAAGDATPAYGRYVGDGTATTKEIYFDKESGHNYITVLAVQHTNAEEKTLKIQPLTLVDEQGAQTTVYPTFTTWAGTDQTVYTGGTVSLPNQYMQLQISGATGMKDITVRVEFAEPVQAGIQFCIDYDNADSEWPQMKVGESIQEVKTSREGATIKNLGIQRQAAGDYSVTVLGAWLVDTTTGISSQVALPTSDAAYNLAGQRVNANAKGIVIANGKKMFVK